MTPDREAGSASIYVLAGCLLLGVAALVPLATAVTAVARQRAAVAADAAALAGAAALAQSGSTTTACRRAGMLARADDARLVSCLEIPCGLSAGSSIQVAVTTTVAFSAEIAGVTELARAGPAACLVKSLPTGSARRSLGRSGVSSTRP